MKFPRTFVYTACTALAVALVPTTTFGAGFAIAEQSVTGLGNAFAGGGAEANDASIVWYNPAGMTHIKGAQFEAGINVIDPQFEFTNSGSTQVGGAGGVLLPTGAKQKDDGGVIAPVPNLYYVRDLTENVKFGLGVNAPFGLATKYNQTWVGRYHAVKSEIRTINVNPALATKLGNLSIGAGVSWQYFDATLTRAVDFDAVCAANAGAFAAFCSGAPGSGTSEGFVRNKADDTSWGFNLGLLYELSEDTRMSLAYRSRIKHKLDGVADFQTPATAVNAIPAVNAALLAPFADDGIKVGIEMPETLSFSLFHRTGKIGLLGDVTWTGWSSIPELRIKFDNAATAGGDSVESLFFRDAWRLSLGLNYYMNERLTLRTGAAFDQSPIKSPQLRIASLPDNNRTWVSVGASYRFTDSLNADFAYSHQFLPNTTINRVNSTGATLNGKYDNQGNILSAQVRYQW